MTQPNSPVTLAYASQRDVITTRQILVRWEKYRLLYNGILVLLTLALAGIVRPSILINWVFWTMCVCGAIPANICYCLGPYLDLWLHEWRPQQLGSTVTLFILGMIFSAIMTVIATLLTLANF